MKRSLLLTLIGGILMMPIVAAVFFYAEEDWRGARDWAACQHELHAKGEILDLRQLVPPGKPEDDLSKVPIFADIYQNPPPSDGRLRQVDVYLGVGDTSDLPKFSGFPKGKPLNLANWQTFYRSLPKAGLLGVSSTPAQDVLTVLNRFDSEMNEIDASVKNPHAYWPVDYTQPFATPLAGITGMLGPAKVLELRAIAHLENNQIDLAEGDYLASFHLEQPILQRCFLVNYLVTAGIRTIDDSILWEGLRHHVWNDTQLHAMDYSLAANDMLELAVKSLQLERAEGLLAIEYAHKNTGQVAGMAPNSDIKSKVVGLELTTFLKIRPSGLDVQELAFYSSEMQRQIDAINVLRGVLNPQFYKNWKDPRTFEDWTKINLVTASLLLIPNKKLGVNIAKAETYRRLARLACRLEEYRIAQGHYPEKLEELPDLPAHLNQEVLSEQPLRYQRKGEGYSLYSIGWDQKDDGGVMDGDPQKGDWVWPSP